MPQRLVNVYVKLTEHLSQVVSIIQGGVKTHL